MPILIADDDEISRDLLEHTLRSAGHDVRLASDGEEAWEILQQGECRFLISDWEMPRMNGPQLCRAIRSGDLDGYVYVILLTSRSGTDEIVTGMSAGADDFIAKPFNAAELLVRVRAGLRVLSLETRDVAIFSLAKLAESRDPETGHHLERVQYYSRALAQQLCRNSHDATEIDQELVRLIFLTSPLHDIGKVAIPDCVLRKPGRLTESEFNVMKTHATVGEDTLEAALRRYPEAQFLKVARDIAASHHERWDGTGYPRGLAGENIPLCGRIVAVADVYDALTSKRVYKDAFDHVQARSIITEESGTHFDPAVVEAFLQIEDEFLAIHEQFREDSQDTAPIIKSAKPVSTAAS